SYYGVRYYDNLLLGWTQADPMYRFVPDAAWDEPRRGLLYAFSLHSPLRYIDPDGLDACEQGSGGGSRAPAQCDKPPPRKYLPMSIGEVGSALWGGFTGWVKNNWRGRDAWEKCARQRARGGQCSEEDQRLGDQWADDYLFGGVAAGPAKAVGRRLFRNLLPKKLKQEMAKAAAVGAKPIRAGAPGFDDLVNAGPIKWVITEGGELVVGPHTRSTVEISHAVLSRGGPVRAAGQAEIASAGGRRVGLAISAHSGHFLHGAPASVSDEVVKLGREAFAQIGVIF
ncbi:MAG: hypothetical protein KJZ91_31575, partial [Myxococcales bacterium]|nr:hypothetical protein [Myxococcales bacterium]